MSTNLKETEESLDRITNLLYQAQKPAEGLVAKFGESVSESKQLQIIMRFLSGSATWRFLNKMKAAAMMIQTWNNNMEEHNKQLREAANQYAEEVKIHKELKEMADALYSKKSDEQLLQSEMGVGLKEIYGEEYARFKLQEMTLEGLEAQEKKMNALAKINMQSKDILAALDPEGEGVADKETRERLQKEGARRGLGKVKDGKWVEHSGFKKFFTKKWAGFKNVFTTIGAFMKQAGRMAWQYIKDGAKLIGLSLLYIGLIVMAVILLKPFFVRVWDAWKMIQEKSGLFIEAWGNFVENFRERWANLSGAFMNFWRLLWDKEATFSETLWAFLKFIWAGVELVWGTLWDLFLVLAALGWELLMAGLMGLGQWLADTAVWLKDKFVDWFKQKFIDGKSWWQSALQIIITAAGVYAGWIVGATLASSINPAYAVVGSIALAAASGVAASWMAGKMMGFAKGGIVPRSGSFMVGERGPEIVSLPRGAKVTPNHQIRNTGGNTVHVHVSGRVGASDQEIRDIARKVGAQVSREINRTTPSGVRL